METAMRGLRGFHLLLLLALGVLILPALRPAPEQAPPVLLERPASASGGITALDASPAPR
jgi:hypothetical protein